MGAKDFGMRIWLDPTLMKARGLTTIDVIDALREQNVQVAAGQIGGAPSPKDQPFEYTITTLGRLESVEQFENIIVKTGDGGPDRPGQERGAGRARRPVVPVVRRSSTALRRSRSQSTSCPRPTPSTWRTAFGPRWTSWRPTSLTTSSTGSSTTPPSTSSQSIKEVITTLIVAILLVVFTVYVFLQDFRTTLVPAITIPVSLLGTFAVMMAIGPVDQRADDVRADPRDRHRRRRRDRRGREHACA